MRKFPLFSCNKAVMAYQWINVFMIHWSCCDIIPLSILWQGYKFPINKCRTIVTVGLCLWLFSYHQQQAALFWTLNKIWYKMSTIAVPACQQTVDVRKCLHYFCFDLILSEKVNWEIKKSHFSKGNKSIPMYYGATSALFLCTNPIRVN